MNAPITVVIIAQNEEKNIRYCLESVRNWCTEVFVVDSFSTDKTSVISRDLGATIVEHQFEDWALQRNWALETLPIKTNWVLFLDADEQATEDFKQEVTNALESIQPGVIAFYVHFDFYFYGRLLEHAYESPHVIRLVQKGKVRWQGVGAREYCEVYGAIASIKNHIWHEDHKGLSAWVDKQNRNASREADVLWHKVMAVPPNEEISKTSERSLRLWVREHVWHRMPLLVRPWFYFAYRYILRGGFLDGSAGLIYTFLQGLWLTFLIDAKYQEIRWKSKYQEEIALTAESLGNLPIVSVIISTFNRDQSLMDTLQALSDQTMDMRQFEVIIVDDGSTDQTASYISKFTSYHPSLNLHYERHETNRSKAAACNTGIRISAGKIIVFTDDDIRPVSTWLDAHLQRHLMENRAISVTGLVQYPKDWETKSNWIRYGNDNYKKNKTSKPSETGGLPPNRVAGGNFSIPREMLIKAGMFSEELRRGEDTDLACRLHEMGIPLIFEPKALVYHYSEAIKSIDNTINTYRKFYEIDRIIIKQRHPWFFAKTGHWFLEPIESKNDNPWRVFIKIIVRLVSNHLFLQMVIRWLKWADRARWLFWRPLYHYVMVCTAIEAIRISENEYH